MDEVAQVYVRHSNKFLNSSTCSSLSPRVPGERLLTDVCVCVSECVPSLAPASCPVFLLQRTGKARTALLTQIACKRYINVCTWSEPFDFGYG